MITQNYCELLPAYGRDYKNRNDVETDFRNGKDFEMATIGTGGTYCSIRDFAVGTYVNLRYAKHTKVAVIKV